MKPSQWLLPSIGYLIGLGFVLWVCWIAYETAKAMP